MTTLYPPPPPPPRSINKYNSYKTIPHLYGFNLKIFTSAAALAAALLLPDAPAHAALSCNPLQQGTLSADGATFTPGTGASDTDFRLSCTGAGAADVLDEDDVLTAINAFSGQVLDRTDARLVLEFGGSGAAVNSVDTGRIRTVVLGNIRGADGTTGFNKHGAELVGDLNIDSYADVRTTGGARGLRVSNSDETPGGKIRLRNFGRVVTTGEGTAETPRRGYGVSGWSERADIEVSNEAGATIETRGAGGRGLYASIDQDGAAKAVNRGTVITKGGPSGDRRADGVRADSGGSVAEAVNEAGATVRTEGDGARGVYATLCSWTGESCRPGRSGGTATAINRGAVTVTGDSVTVDDRILRPYGVSANVNGGGTARAVNEAGATIRTEGDGARGLHAGHDGAAGRAEAENMGAIVTIGAPAQSGRRQADGLGAWSETRSVQAVNHQGATITTEGVGAEGIDAAVGRGGAGTSAVAVNRGTIRTSGGVFNESRIRQSNGMGVYTGFDGALSAARVEAVNEATGVIETRGDGARGVFALIGTDGSGAGQATNRGRVTTRGNVVRVDREGEDDDLSLGAHGVDAATYGSGAVTAANEVGGIVETHGTVAFGLMAWSGGAGAAKVVNKGRVTTHQLEAAGDLPGDLPDNTGARGAWAFSRSGNAVVENEPTGRVETRGARAFGLYAQIEGDGSRTSVMAEARNRGTVITGGWNADAVIAIAPRGGGTAANPSVVRAYNEAGATITTAGDGSGGLAAGVLVSGSGTVDAFGSLRAENHGTIETSGGVPDGLGPRFGAFGVSASFFKYADSTTIGNAGDVDVVNTGRITVSGAQAVGLMASTSGTGTATVTMTGGRVAATRGDDPDTADVDEGGFGIWAESGAAGTVEVTVSGSAEVTAPTAVRIAGGAGAGAVDLNLFDTSTLTGRVDLTRAASGARFTIRDGFMDGAVRFGAGDDHLRMERRGFVSGAIDFGGGTDTITLDVRGSGAEASSFEGAISGLEYLYKRGAGVARIGDAAFSGSELVLEEGGLRVAGHLDLGPEGVLTVHDGTRLTVEIGDVTVDAGSHGRITAGAGVTWQGQEAPALHLAIAAGLEAKQEEIGAALQQPQSAIQVLGEGTRVRTRADAESEPADAQATLRTSGAGGAVQNVGVVAGDGKAQVLLDEGQRIGLAAGIEPPKPPEPEAPAAEGPPAPVSKGDGGNPPLFIGGAGVLLASWLFDLFDAEEEAALADWEEQGPRRRTSASLAGLGAGHFEERRVRSGGLEQWSRAFAGRAPSAAGGATGAIRGAALGLDARLGQGFRLGVTAMPDLSVSSHAGPASELGSDAHGGYYAVRGGWRADALFANAGLSRGSYRVRSLIANPAAGGVLGGELDLVQGHARATAGVRLDLGGLRATPALTFFSGSLRQGGYTARGGALLAEAPGFSQRYQGWKARLDLAPSGWRDGPGALRWRPGAHLSTTRTRTRGPAWLDVRQSDRSGVLSFTSRARVQELPRTVHAVGASLTAKRSDRLRFRAGYAGMMVEGEPVHGAVAGLSVRF